MEAFLLRKRKRSTDETTTATQHIQDEDSTEIKLALLASLNPDLSQEVLLDYLLAHSGSVEEVVKALYAASRSNTPRKRPAANGYQSSLTAFQIPNDKSKSKSSATRPLTKKGQTLHLYSPEDVEKHTPCSIIHNFLPVTDADALLKELLNEAPSFARDTFQLFDKTVESPHTMAFYVDSFDEAQEQKDKYVYNGSLIADVRQTQPQMLRTSDIVRVAVNAEIERRTRDFCPNSEKLKFQSPDEWRPNTSFVNCYDGAKESVGYHADQLTYLGPRAVIGSLSLGVAREFRVRKIVPPDEASAADAQGQIAIHLPHNSLLVMHAEMQEEWKHAVAPAQAIDPHPIAGNKRLNVTYRCYQEYLHPKYTPRCKCGVPCVLRCVQKRKATRGRYMWMCHRNYTPDQQGCSFFDWAKFDVDGRPPWAKSYKGNANMVVDLSKGTG